MLNQQDINKWAGPISQQLDQAELQKVMSGSLAPNMDTDTPLRNYLNQLVSGAQSGKYDLNQLNTLWNQGSGMLNQTAGRVANAQNALDAQANKINSAEEAVGGNYKQANADKIADARQSLGTYNDSLKNQINAAQVGGQNALFNLLNKPQQSMQQPKPMMPQQAVQQMARPMAPQQQQQPMMNQAIQQMASMKNKLPALMGGAMQQPQQTMAQSAQQQSTNPFLQWVQKNNIQKPSDPNQARQVAMLWKQIYGAK